MTAERPARGTRPRNRRALILDVAADLFVRVGYPRVAMSDIAEAVAISPSALYRHFRGKEEILHEAVRTRFLSISATVRDSTPHPLESLLGALAEAVLDDRGLGILWQRESRHLPPERRTELRVLLVDVEKDLSARLRAERRELTDPQASLLAWATLAGLMSVAFQRVELPRPEYLALLTGIGRDVVSTLLDGQPATGQAVAAPASPPGSARAETTADLLVATATRLFAERGFQSVGIDEVAAEVGITGPSVYHHFAGKLELLAAAMGDGARTLLGERAAIVDSGAPPEQMLGALVRSYVDYSFEHRHVVDLMITETASLPPEEQRSGLDRQRSYVADWVRLLCLARPELQRAEARVRVQAVLTVTNDISRTAHLRAQPGTREAVTAIGAAVLGLPRTDVRSPADGAGRARRGVASPAG